MPTNQAPANPNCTIGACSPDGRPDPSYGPDGGPQRVGIHVYGSKAALCFEADETRGAVPTVALDAASATGPKQYDWAHKIRLQLTRNELPVTLCVLVGYLPKAEFKNHGPANDKGFSIEHQGDKLFVRVWARDQGVKAVPMSRDDAFYVVGLFLRQLCLAAPWLSAGDQLQVAGRVFAPRAVGSPGDGSHPRQGNPISNSDTRS